MKLEDICIGHSVISFAQEKKNPTNTKQQKTKQNMVTITKYGIFIISAYSFDWKGILPGDI